MYETLHIIGIVLAVLAAAALIASVAIFFGFRIPTLLKDSHGNLEQKQIEEIRKKSNAAALHRNKVNVFEELEKKAKVKKPNTHSLNVGPTTSPLLRPGEETMPLSENAAPSGSGFVVEESIVLVSTDEVI